MKYSALPLVSETSNHLFPLTMGKCSQCLDILHQEAANQKRRHMPIPAFQDDHSEFSSILYIGGEVERDYCGGGVFERKVFTPDKYERWLPWSTLL